MKDPIPLSIDDVVASLDRFDAILDARSPSEHGDDHLPGSSSAPVLDDSERAEVGTLHAQVGAFAARRRGAALVSRNIGRLLETALADKPPDWQPLVYCWRGGNRSGSLATVLARVGWRTSVLVGGYREFRRRVIADLAAWPSGLRFVVVAGRTGSAKSRILQALAAQGRQVLDLEAIGRHRGSVLGGLPDAPQPSQKRFESELWDAMRRFDPARPVFVESESKRVGRVHIPDALMRAIRGSSVVRIDMPLDARARFLVDDYAHFVADPASLFAQLDCLVELHGRELIAHWKSLADAGAWEAFVAALLQGHYDPAYDRSMQRNFSALDACEPVALGDFDPASIEGAAARVAAVGEPPAGA